MMQQVQDEETGAGDDTQTATTGNRGDSKGANSWYELQEASMELSQAWLRLPWQLANGGGTDAVASALNRMHRAQRDICQQLAAGFPPPAAAERPEAYCMRCQASRPVDEAEEVTMKNGSPALRGKCGECGTRVFRIQKRSESH